MAVGENTAHPEEAKNFVEFLKTDEAMKVFEEYGFTKRRVRKKGGTIHGLVTDTDIYEDSQPVDFHYVFLGIFAAWAVVSMKNETWKLIWDGVLTLPLVLPLRWPVFSFSICFGVKRPVGQFLLNISVLKSHFHGQPQ